MNGAHLHLLLNHAPLLGTFFGLCTLLYGLWLRNVTAQNIAIAFFILAALLTIPVMLSGEEAEEIVERIPGADKAAIDPHEDIAGIALWAAVATGLLSLIYVTMKVIYKRNYALMASAIFLAALISFGFMFRTAQLGGQIMHKEIESGIQKPMPAESESDD